MIDTLNREFLTIGVHFFLKPEDADLPLLNLKADFLHIES